MGLRWLSRRVLPEKMRQRLMLTSFVMVVLPIVILGVILQYEGREALLQEKQDKLFSLARILDAELGTGFDALLADLPSGWQDRQAAIQHLNARLAPITDKIAASDPGVGVGYYSRRLDAIITYGPSASYGHTVGKAIAPDHPGRAVMRAGQPDVEFGSLVRGSVMNAMWPIRRNGNVIGYIWANEFTDAIERQEQTVDRTVLAITLGGILIAGIVIHLMSKRLSHEVDMIVGGLARLKDDLRQPIAPLRGELGEIVDAVNNMAMALLDARTLTENILTSIADGVVAVDVDGRITAFNPAAEQMYDVPATEVIGQSYRSLFADHMHVASALLDTLDTGRPHIGVTLEIPRKESVWRLTATSSVLHDAENRRIGAVVVLKDVSERDRLMVQVMRADRLAALGELTASIAHEIRNPLTSIRGFVQYLADCDDPEEWRRYSAIIIHEVDVLNDTIGKLLAFGRLRPPKISRIDVAHLIEDVSFLAKGQGNVQIDLQFEKDLPDIDADAEALKQALLNLLINALQAITNDGSVIVTAAREGPDDIAIEVRDDGVGVEPHHVGKVFDPFFSTKPTGTGLGLAMVHRIIDAHHGVISFDSRPGHGTVVRIRIPIVAPVSEKTE
ncbi:two-component system sensor histidine kinase AtoS [Afifella aestuarii]|uniref:two-component system sensor histidine kinase AtoS n=1 Tax=Afifella aestuarii TaxID=1909496 RepID=UPI000FE2C6FC|nr:two-component system sensor histidine kinase AtoS [Afifella aestuarii]